MAKWYQKVGSEISKIGKEVGKGAAVVAKEVGRGAQVAATEARKTVGVGVGDIKTNVKKGKYALGDTLTGNVELMLSEPISAKRLAITLTASRKKISYSKNESGRKTQDTHTETVHSFEVELAPEKEFESGSYEFELPIPVDIGTGKPDIQVKGALGDVARVVASVASANTTAVSWTVAAVLDIPWRRNVSAKVDVAIQKRAGA